MNYVERLLTRNERIVRIARDHWITLLPAIVVDDAIGVVIIGLSVLGGILSPPWTWLGLLLLFVPTVHLALRVWYWWNKQYAITNRRIIQVSGTLNKRISDTSLEKVNDTVTQQSALGRLLKFGDLEIISGSESGIDVFRHIADPILFNSTLIEQKEALARRDVFEERVQRVLSTEAPSAGDIPELIAELDELRQKGIITTAEFEEKKRQLLARI